MHTVITVPTFNEAPNIKALVDEIRRYVPAAHVLVVDDNSPDGTAQIVSKLAQNDSQIHLLSRFVDKGRGRAGRDGFRWALEQGARFVVEMDADFSHHPRYLPALLDAARRADVVIGSRNVAGGCEVGRSGSRAVLTFFVGHFLRFALGVPTRDPSSGFRVWNRRALETLFVDEIISVGPSIVSEMLFKARLNHLRIEEIPIVFEDRTQGESKLDLRTLWNTFSMTFELLRLHRQGRF